MEVIPFQMSILNGKTMKFTPVKIEKNDDRHLKIDWSDKQSANYDVVELRRACSCAGCIDELTGEQKLKPEHVSETVRPVQVRSLGRYALIIDWTDGHTSSIFSWDRLRKLADMV